MAMRIAPPHAHQNTHSTTSISAPSAPGLHDTLRAGVGPLPSSTSSASATSQPISSHPLEGRLKQWEATQESLKLEGLRRTFGIAEPIRRGMELKVVREGTWKPAELGGGLERSVHEDILLGREADCQWEDVFKGEEMGTAGRAAGGMHEEVERKVRMA